MHTEPEQKEKPIMIVAMDEPRDWLIGQIIKLSQLDGSLLMSRPEGTIHYLGNKNPDEIAVKIGKSLQYIPIKTEFTLPADLLEIMQAINTNTEFTVIGSYTRRMSNWHERMVPLIDDMLILQDPQSQKYIVNREIVSSINYPDIFKRERRPM